MRIEYDRDVDALYIRIKESEIQRTVELDEGVNLDFDSSNNLVGIEILNAREKYGSEDIFQFNAEALLMTERV